MSTKTNTSEPALELDISEAEETRRGQAIVAMLDLKEARDDSRRHYTPARYETTWGTKTALGLFRSVEAIVNGRVKG